MPIDTKHADLQGLRIDRSAPAGEPAPWTRRYILIGIGVVVLLSVAALAYRILSPNASEVEVVRAEAENGMGPGGIVLTASGYIVPHHKINVNSKVTGRVAWIGVEKGDKVKQGQVFQAQRAAAPRPCDDSAKIGRSGRARQSPSQAAVRRAGAAGRHRPGDCKVILHYC